MKIRSIKMRFGERLDTLDRRTLMIGLPLVLLTFLLASTHFDVASGLAAQLRVAGLVLAAFVGVLWNARVRHKVASGTIAELRTEVEAMRKRLINHEITSNYDGLTGLPNSKLLVDRFEQSAVRAKRSKTLLAVYTVSVEDYEPISEWHGAEAAVKVASTYATRLKMLLRDSDTIVRERNGDFIILAESVKDQAGVDVLEGKIRKLLAQDVEISDRKVIRTHEKVASACYPLDGMTLQALVSRARSAR